MNFLNGELQYIIDNVRGLGSNSTDIQSPGLHLSISVDNRKVLNKKNIKKVKSVQKPMKRPAFAFNMGMNKKVTNQKNVTRGPKVEILEK